jgi:hypothetical protein
VYTPSVGKGTLAASASSSGRLNNAVGAGIFALLEELSREIRKLTIAGELVNVRLKSGGPRSTCISVISFKPLSHNNLFDLHHFFNRITTSYSNVTNSL